MSVVSTRRDFYPPIEPYASGHLDVGDGHSIYYETVGSPAGKPVLYVHGGPGSGCTATARRFFNPAKYRVVLVDQRGAGKSLPFASLENNTSQHLVADLEKVRVHLGIEAWVVFGGSWGSTLGLYYAQCHPERVLGLILRGIFTLRKKEVDWFYEDVNGASMIYPDAWEDYASEIPEGERGEGLVKAYYARLCSDDEAVRLSAAKKWSIWEANTSKLFVDPVLVSDCGQDAFALARSRIECHYFINGGFFERDGQLLEKASIDRIRHIPTTIVQGRYDIVCPIRTAWDLHKAFPEASFVLVPDAGHSMGEAGIQTALLDAADAMAN